MIFYFNMIMKFNIYYDLIIIFEERIFFSLNKNFIAKNDFIIRLIYKF